MQLPQVETILGRELMVVPEATGYNCHCYRFFRHGRGTINTPSGFGYTLLELLIAMAILGVLSIMAYSGLKIILETRSATAIRASQLADLQNTLYLLGEDLSQLLDRSVRDEYGLVEASCRSDGDAEQLTLSRSLPNWAGNSKTANLRRISYRFEQGALYRLAWSTLDRSPSSSQPQRRRLLTLKNIQLRFFADGWQTHWSAGIPKAIEVSLTVNGLGSVQRLFYLRDR